jgi:ribosomal protein S13
MVDMWRDTADALRQEAAGTGRAMADAIVDNLDVDMEKLIQNFVKANVAEEIAGVLTEGFKEPLGNLKDIIRAEFADPENIGQLGEEQVGRLNDILENKLGKGRDLEPQTVKDAIINTYPELTHRVMRDVEVEGNLWERRLVTELLPELDEIVGGGFGKKITGKNRVFTKGAKSEFELIAEAVELQRLSMKKGGGAATVAKLAQDGALMETEMDSMLERLKKLGILQDRDSGQVTEGVPTATFRAVTEPQANQMLLIMTQQVNHLHAIENNTSVLPIIADKIVDRGRGTDPFQENQQN